MGDRGDLLGRKDERGQLGNVEEVAGWAWERVREKSAIGGFRWGVIVCFAPRKHMLCKVEGVNRL